jgi:hypothetical protein
MADADKRELADGEESEAKRTRAHVRHEAAPVLAAESSSGHEAAPVLAAESSSGHIGWDDDDATGLKSALQDVTLIDAAWLANLADNGSSLPSWQELPAEAKVTLAEIRTMVFWARWGLVASPRHIVPLA